MKFVRQLSFGLLCSAAVLNLQGCGDDSQAIEASAEATHSSTPTGSQRSAPPAQPVELKVLNISERSFENRPALAAVLSTPVDPSERHDKYLSVTLAGSDEVDGAWVSDEAGRILYFPHIQPEQKYVITVREGLTAANDTELAEDAEFTVTTRKVTPAVSFASQGLILPAELTKGLPLLTVNVPLVDVDFMRVPPANLSRFFDDFGTPQNTQSYSFDSLKKLTEHVHSGRFELPVEDNRRITTHLPVETIPGLEQPGLYIAVLRQPGEFGGQFKTAYFFVSDIGLHLRQYPDRIDIYASSLKTGQPLKNIDISLWHDRENTTIKTGQTNREGYFSYTGSRSHMHLVTAQHGAHISAIPLRRSALDLADFDLGSRSYRPSEVFLYGPRDIYRPGETVDIAALLRDADGRAVPAMPLKVEIRPPAGGKAEEFTWQPKHSGFYHHRYTLSEKAKTGTWTMWVWTDPAKKQQAERYRFKVEDFLPERMKLDLTAKKPILQPTDALEIDVTGMYLFGAPTAGNRLSGVAQTRPARQLFADNNALKKFEFGDVDQQRQDRWQLPDQTLDNNGNITVKIPSRWQKATSPQNVFTTFELFESGGRPVTRVLRSAVWPAEQLVGIKPLFTKGRIDEGDTASFEVGLFNPQGEFTATDVLQVEVIKEDRDYYWEYSASQGWHHKYVDNQYPIHTDAINTTTDGATTIDIPTQNWGQYLLKITNPATKLVSTLRFHAGWSWWDQDGNTARPDKVNLVLDKNAYQSGDEIKLTVLPPHAGSALVTVESDKTLWAKRFDIGEQGETIRILTSKDWNRHDLHISAVVFRPGDAKAAITPNRAFGLIPLPLDRSDRKHNIVIDAPEKIVPDSTLTTTIKIDNAGDKTTHVTLAAVDVGVLSITDFDTPEPFDWFFQRRRYNVTVKDLYGAVIENLPGQAAKQRWGGDAAIDAAGMAAKARVKIVSFFNGPVELDENGKAEIKLDIPDFNGRIRLMALSFSEDGYGAAERDVTIAAPIVTQISRPRFLSAGDRSTLTLDVHNLSGDEQRIDLQIKTGGPLQLLQGKKTVTLADKAKTTLRFPLTVGEKFGTFPIDLELVAGDYTLKRHWQLDVRPAYPAASHRQRAVLSKDQPLAINADLVKDLFPATVQGVLQIADAPPIDISSQLLDLYNYPYQCVEQASSQGFPLLYATQAVRDKIGLKAISEKARLARIATTIKRVSERQKSSGGFGVWHSNDSESQWLNVYATDFLLSAREQGFEVSKSVIDKAMRRMKKVLQSTNPIRTIGYSDNQDHQWFATRAYAGYLLARVKRAPLGTLRTLFDNHKDMAQSGLPLVHLGLALELQGDKRRAGEALNAGVAKKRLHGRYLGDYGSSTRDLAAMVALLYHHKHSDMALALMLQLETALRPRNWFSTQEKNALFMAGFAIGHAQTEPWEVLLKIGADTQKIAHQGSYQKRLGFDPLSQGLNLKLAGERSLYAMSRIVGHRKTPPEPRYDDMRLERRYYTTEGQPLAGDLKLNVGDLVVVEVRVKSDKHQRLSELLVVDLLPAGLEIENQNLKHALKLDSLIIDGKPLTDRIQTRGLRHSESLDDRYIAAIDFQQRHGARMYYLARAVTPGEYRVPPTFAEDMYRPEIHGIGEAAYYLSVVEKTP